MNPVPSTDELNDRALTTLVRTLQYSRGQFSLVLVRCNYASLRSRMVQALEERCPFPITTVTLPETAKTLLTSLRTALNGQGATDGIEVGNLGCENTEASAESTTTPETLMVFGLEAVTLLDQLLISTNQVREEFRKRFPFPVVLWVNDQVLTKVMKRAPDFKNWASVSIRFDLARADLLRFLKSHTDQLFASILHAGDEQSLTSWVIAPASDLLRVPELEFAIADLASHHEPLDPTLEASLNFLRGQLSHAQGQLEAAETYYDKSLTYWLHCADRSNTASTDSSLTSSSQPSSEDLSTRLDHTNWESPNSYLPPNPSFLERAACIYFYLGLAWRAHSVLQRSIRTFSYRQAETYFRQSLELFEQENRQDLVARFVLARMEVIQKLANSEKLQQADWWQTLETLAHNALKLHHLYPDLVRQARDHGFLAEVALFHAAWARAKHHAEAALRIIQKIEQEADRYDILHPHLETSLELAQTYHRGWYWYLLARAEKALGNLAGAIAHLEAAVHQIHPQHDPPLYIRILETLRDVYYQQKRYRDAFHIKLYQRTIERQFGFRAFVGALRLQPQTLGGLTLALDTKQLLAQEIAASGRQQDVDRLISRLGRDDIKLTVIHGDSGVGKSSIISAGLIPTLHDRLIGERVALPILCDRYTDWQTPLLRSLTNAVQALQASPQEASTPFSAEMPQSPNPLTPTKLPTLLNIPTPTEAATPQINESSEAKNATLIALLQDLTVQNRLSVLIFDQFEEFFFIQDTPQQRRPFYDFLRTCLNLDHVKIVLALREDYLHYMLEFQRLARIDGINLDDIEDILGKTVRYPLGDFSPADAKAVITSLTNQSQFYLEPDLIDELVRDLAQSTGEVRPIELQVVGAELQAEGIDTLDAYRQKGPKERLVQHSLESVIYDCGTTNERVARTILYLLTNENGTRPLKTREDLETDLVDLGLTHEIDKLDLVLEVLVGSGLVFQFPDSPDDYYQLVHDYLVSFIRQQQGSDVSRLQEASEEERQQREQAESRLSDELKQRLLLESGAKIALQRQLRLARLIIAVLTGSTWLFIGLWLYANHQKQKAETREQINLHEMKKSR